jgi:hypothetical protein
MDAFSKQCGNVSLTISASPRTILLGFKGGGVYFGDSVDDLRDLHYLIGQALERVNILDSQPHGVLFPA